MNDIFSIETSKIDGEPNDKIRKVFDLNTIIKYDNIDKNYQKNIYLVPRGAKIKTDSIGIIVNINNESQHFSQKKSRFDKYRINIEINFLILTVFIWFSFLILYFIKYNHINWYIAITILMNIQMINPMTINTLVFFI